MSRETSSIVHENSSKSTWPKINSFTSLFPGMKDKNITYEVIFSHMKGRNRTVRMHEVQLLGTYNKHDYYIIYENKIYNLQTNLLGHMYQVHLSRQSTWQVYNGPSAAVYSVQPFSHFFFYSKITTDIFFLLKQPSIRHCVGLPCQCTNEDYIS